MKKPTKKKQPKKRFNLIYNPDLWLWTDAQIKEYRESMKQGCCPVSLEDYSLGMKQCVLDHDHKEPFTTRGTLGAKSNLWLGRIEKYFGKLFGWDYTTSDLADHLERLALYLRDSCELQPVLHRACVTAEERKLTRWRNETVYNKLIEKGLELNSLNSYTKHELVELWLNEFIKDCERNLMK